MMKSVVILRKLALAEAVSYLLLLGVAMPLKYMAGKPMAVTVVGAIHGALFVMLMGGLLHTLWFARWPLSRGILVFVASLIPFAPFFLDARMRKWVEESNSPKGC